MGLLIKTVLNLEPIVRFYEEKNQLLFLYNPLNYQNQKLSFGEICTFVLQISNYVEETYVLGIRFTSVKSHMFPRNRFHFLLDVFMQRF